MVNILNDYRRFLVFLVLDRTLYLLVIFVAIVATLCSVIKDSRRVRFMRLVSLSLGVVVIVWLFAFTDIWASPYFQGYRVKIVWSNSGNYLRSGYLDPWAQYFLNTLLLVEWLAQKLPWRYQVNEWIFRNSVHDNNSAHVSKKEGCAIKQANVCTHMKKEFASPFLFHFCLDMCVHVHMCIVHV